MGVCDSTNNTKKTTQKKVDIKKTPDKTNSTTHGTISNNKLSTVHDSSDDYILPSSLAKRDDITKYYKLDSEILGQGASGTVCIGEKKGEKYAIKRINKMSIKSKSGIIKEAEFSKLKHPNIIEYFDIFEDLKTISFVMELGEGGDLFDFIVNSPIGHLPLDLTIDLMVQIMSTIDYLHNTMHIVHRDIKPENFMITIDSGDKALVKLIDFGMSTYFPPNGKLLTEYLGTPNYAAPEIISHLGYNEKVDIWAIGVLLFNMMTGYEPFRGESRSELDDEIKFKQINFELLENDQLRELCEKLLTRNVKERIGAKEGLEIIKKIKEEREELYRKEEEEERKGEEQDEINKDREDYNTFWSAFAGRIGMGV